VRGLLTAAALTLALAAVSGCAKPEAPRSFTVTIANMAYGALPPSLRTGDKITWVNKDLFQHTITAKDGSFDLDLPPNGQGVTVMSHAGTIDFYCRYHPGMSGRLSVAG
jgi:plastocyanin